MQGQNKQLALVCGIPVAARSMMAFEKCESVAEIIVVTRTEDIETMQQLAEQYRITKLSCVVPGGSTRQESVLNGVRKISDDTKMIDCRSTHNPGKYEQYKHLTGKDQPVIDFLEQDGEILTFLESVYRLIDHHVERFLERGFSHLQIAFGCTGGQHRSVYSAEAAARHLRERFPNIHIELFHREQPHL